MKHGTRSKGGSTDRRWGALVILVLAGFSTVAMAGCTNPVMPIVKALTARPDGSADADPAATYSVRYEGNGHTGGQRSGGRSRVRRG